MRKGKNICLNQARLPVLGIVVSFGPEIAHGKEQLQRFEYPIR